MKYNVVKSGHKKFEENRVGNENSCLMAKERIKSMMKERDREMNIGKKEKEEGKIMKEKQEKAGKNMNIENKIEENEGTAKQKAGKNVVNIVKERKKKEMREKKFEVSNRKRKKAKKLNKKMIHIEWEEGALQTMKEEENKKGEVWVAKNEKFIAEIGESGIRIEVICDKNKEWKIKIISEKAEKKIESMQLNEVEKSNEKVENIFINEQDNKEKGREKEIVGKEEALKERKAALAEYTYKILEKNLEEVFRNKNAILEKSIENKFLNGKEMSKVLEENLEKLLYQKKDILRAKEKIKINIPPQRGNIMMQEENMQAMKMKIAAKKARLNKIKNKAENIKSEPKRWKKAREGIDRRVQIRIGERMELKT